MNRTISLVILISVLAGCGSQRGIDEREQVIVTVPAADGRSLEIEFTAGKHFKHPSFVVWTEDLEGNYRETLYVTGYVAKGVFGYGEREPGKWKNEPGEVRRPASLPYWAHKRNIQAPDGLYIPSPETAVPDGLTSATPKGDFTLKTKTSLAGDQKFRILFEINQPWDSNEHWTNSRFEDDPDYFASLQPALVYEAVIDPGAAGKEYYLNPVGHSHPSGKTGELFTNLSTLTTAKEIVSEIKVTLN